MSRWVSSLFGSLLSAQSLLQTADSLLKQGQYAAALALYDSLLRTEAMADTLRLRVYLRGAEAWGGVNKPQEALGWIASAETLALRLGDTLRYAELLGWKGVYYRQRRAYAEAEVALQRAIRLVEGVGGQPSLLYGVLWRRWGAVAQEQGRYEEAVERYRRGARVLEGLGLVEHPDYALTLSNLAAVYYAQGRYGEAEGLYLEARAIYAKVLGTEHPDYYHYLLYNLACLYQKQRRYGEADTLWRAVVLKTFTRIRREFPVLSTAARQNLLENIMQGDLLAFQRYVAERREHSEMVELGYRAARSFKGLLLSSTEAMKHLVETSRDTVLRARYRQWKHLADQYAFF
ncbi:MAG: tetratricopeptide repeat protein, partial [Bacteroidia bacterium]|nr:tetratricopeptide repeat protein [Bacteroidia bacterium]